MLVFVFIIEILKGMDMGIPCFVYYLSSCHVKIGTCIFNDMAIIIKPPVLDLMLENFDHIFQIKFWRIIFILLCLKP